MVEQRKHTQRQTQRQHIRKHQFPNRLGTLYLLFVSRHYFLPSKVLPR